MYVPPTRPQLGEPQSTRHGEQVSLHGLTSIYLQCSYVTNNCKLIAVAYFDHLHVCAWVRVQQANTCNKESDVHVGCGVQHNKTANVDMEICCRHVGV